MGLDRGRSGRRTRAVVVGAVAVLVALGLLAGLASVIVRTDREARAALEDEQAGRADVAAAFVRAFVVDVHARMADLAGDHIPGGPLGAGALADVAEHLGAETAAVIDDQGRVVANHPSDESQVGAQVAAGSRHLTAALAGTPSVSRVVGSRLVPHPIIAFAVPLGPPGDERGALSAGFRFGAMPIGRFFADAVSSERREVVLVDDLGVIVAADPVPSARSELADEDPVLAGALAAGATGTYERGGEERWYASQAVDGTPWSIVVSLPADELYAPVGDLGWIGRLLFAAFAVAAVAVALLVARQVSAARRYERLARIDQLTGLANRRHLQEALERMAALGRRHRRPVAVMLIDVDHFKKVNDTHGHKAGDRVLVALAGELSEAVRTADLVGRWGGEEFLAVLPDTDADAAATVAERVRDRVSALTWPWADVHVTVSVGVGAGTHAPDHLLIRADAALYAGKERGRDRVEVVDHPLAPELVADRRGSADRREPGDLDTGLGRLPAPSRARGEGSPG